jgi:hypothetical protein
MTTYYFIFGGENSHPTTTCGFAYSMMDPTTLLPGVKASGRCPPLLIRDDAIVEGGVFEMALLRSLNMVHGESSKSNNKLMDFVPDITEMWDCRTLAHVRSYFAYG